MALASGSAPLVTASNQLFSIGNVAFIQDEAPEELAISSSQNLAVHDLIGGNRVIQALGTVWKPLKFEGVFWGANAEYRSRLLARMKAEGTIHRLTYLSYAFQVVIEEFTANYKHQYKCEYTISVQILKDVSGVVSYSTPTSVDSQIQTSVASATALTAKMDSGSAAAVKPSFQAMTSSIHAAGPAAQATGPVAQTASLSISNAITQAQQVLSIPPVTSTTASLLNVTQYLNCLSVVQKNFNSGQAPNQVSLNGGSLFDIAAQFYGDPSLATALQVANGLSSTHLPSGVFTVLTLPPLQSTKG